ncbi:MAG: sigma-54-dependent Fis family transcriptional regulator [Candidatus Eisenbacteria bacterium]|uniref:Sigma-54-dependent Fis family transcriptional regulator n=1 Tax=Eiseniibacteriota bacterium TaxID=2212470 RepID=A0A538SPE3_UNCEI|nr:MAG: sigma-54-dependent Fis family transcriptional regulator [Candidatus Eisenbacteria bacterium]
MKATVLVIDDDETIRHFLPRELKAEGYQVLTADSGKAGLQLLEKEPADLVLLDIRLPDLTGIQVLERIRAQWPDQIVVMLTGEPDHETAVQAMRLGARDYLTKGKPIREELLLVLDRELSAQRLGREVQHHREQKSQKFSRDFVRGQSTSMQQVYTVVEQVAQSDSTSVLIEGESGTGKELIAHWIHELSARRDKPMLEVNCAAIPRELLESELFGHEKGAFTDARQQKQGLLELANGGTLFLDEVGEMSLTIQVKVLRVLERMTFKRVGGTKDITVSVRVISATNQNLETMVREQRFREDLFYRLKVVPIRVPPLRERREDILPLARHFLAQFNRLFGKSFSTIDTGAEQILLSYPWPGNIRELRNLFERIVLLSQGDRIVTQHLTAAIAPAPTSGRADSSLSTLRSVLEAGQIPEGGFDLEGTLGRIERDIIQRALDRSGGNQSRTANLLQMKRDKLRYRMKLYGFQDTPAADVG